MLGKMCETQSKQKKIMEMFLNLNIEMKRFASASHRDFFSLGYTDFVKILFRECLQLKWWREKSHSKQIDFSVDEEKGKCSIWIFFSRYFQGIFNLKCAWQHFVTKKIYEFTKGIFKKDLLSWQSAREMEFFEQLWQYQLTVRQLVSKFNSELKFRIFVQLFFDKNGFKLIKGSIFLSAVHLWILIFDLFN